MKNADLKFSFTKDSKGATYGCSRTRLLAKHLLPARGFPLVHDEDEILFTRFA